MEIFTPPSPRPTAIPTPGTNAKLLVRAMKDTHGIVWDTSLSVLNETQAIDHTPFPSLAVSQNRWCFDFNFKLKKKV